MKSKIKTQHIALGIYFAIIVLFAFLRMASGFGWLNFLGKYGGYVFSLIVQVGILLGLSFFVFSLLKKKKLKETLHFYKFKKISGNSFLICLFLGVIVFFVNTFVSSFFNSIISWFGYYPNQNGAVMTSYPFYLLLINIFFTALLPGVCEEVAHRGMVLNSISKFGKAKAIFLSALMFGALHMNIEQFFYATLFGLLFGYLTLSSDSIYPAMIIHFVNNALSVVMSYSLVNGLAFSDIFVWLDAILKNSVVAGMMLIFFLIILLVSLAYFLVKKLQYNNFKAKFLQAQNQLKDAVKKQQFLFEIENINKQNQDKLSVQINVKKQSIPPQKMDGLCKIFIFGSLFLSLIVTICTFIWGAL